MHSLTDKNNYFRKSADNLWVLCCVAADSQVFGVKPPQTEPEGNTGLMDIK